MALQKLKKKWGSSLATRLANAPKQMLTGRGGASLALFGVYVIAAACGLALAEIWHIGTVLGASVLRWLSEVQPEFLLAGCAFAVLVILGYTRERDAYLKAARYVRSGRIDVATAVIVGVLAYLITRDLPRKAYEKILVEMPPGITLYLLCLALTIAICSSIRTRFLMRKPPTTWRSIFIEDQALKEIEQDALNVKESAERFALNVMNEHAPTSLVFGVDSPWGIGKSSFINFCRPIWERQGDVIVYDFQPLRFEDKSKLVQKFIEGFVQAVNQKLYLPEIEPLLSRYARLVGQSDISVLGLKLTLKPGEESIDDTLADLRKLLASARARIIVVVDDLDRLELGAVKEILFAIRTSFDLPYVNFVLCYDTTNLASPRTEKGDAEKIREFLEKYVNVKLSLFIESSALLKYVTSDFSDSLAKSVLMSPQKIDQVKNAASELKKIFSGNDYPKYMPVVGDPRKLKRLVNTLLMLDLEKIDISQSDFNRIDLLNLVFIYLNFPELFRAIYDSETGGRSGPYSVRLAKSSSASGHYRNSKRYKDILDGLPATQAHLLGKLFSVDAKLKSMSSAVTEDELLSFACFNGRAGSDERNLERYLHAIVRVAKPNVKDGIRYLVEKKKQLQSGVPLEVIFNETPFDRSNGESLRNEFWNMIGNTAYELSPQNGVQILEYAINTIPEYAQLEIPEVGVGARDSMPYVLIKVLEDAGWGKDLESKRVNTPENIAEIAERILGVGRFVRSGIVERLADIDRGPLGIFDALLFRLQCSADRGGRTFNIARALVLYENKDGPTQGLTSEIARHGMRLVSQQIFSIFSRDYIHTKRNLLREIDDLPTECLCGEYFEFIKSKEDDGTLDVNRIRTAAETARSRLKSFSIYQLANDVISSGVGCGFYDVSGAKDDHEIKQRMSEYLFRVCFAIDVDVTNAECFVDYMLLGFERIFERPGASDFVPSLDSVTRVLDAQQLHQYWIRNRDGFLSLGLSGSSKQVRSSNAVLTYERSVPQLFEALDKWVADFGKPA